MDDKIPVVVGIDPGKTGGAVALGLDGSALEWIAANHPEEGYTVKGKGGGHYIPSAMALWLYDVDQDYKVVGVVVEQQQARPIEGRSSVFTTGYGFGIWIGILAALRFRYTVAKPTVWTRAVFGSKPKGDEKKARSVTTAAARVPDLPLTWGRKTKPHDGLSDAACLALYGLSLLPRQKAI
jgi:crossover junction endodeoxyribonuclease RuvC